MGRVTDVHHGKDGYVRVVTLKTKGREIQRPVVKIAPLPIQKSEQTSPIDPDMKSDSVPPKTHKRARGNKQCFITSMLLLLMTCVLPATAQTLHIDKIQTNNSLYFDKIADIRIIQDEWKMVAFYNMTTYWDSICSIEKYIQLIKTKCNNDYTCAPIIAQFEHELDELRHYNDLLTSHPNTNRQRRGLANGVGYLANTLFGVLDDRFAEKYEKDIDTITKREDHIFNLYKNQTSILEAHNNILKRNEIIMKNQFDSIAKTVHNLIEDVNQAQSTSLRLLNSFSLLSSMVAADVIISNLRRIQDTLVDTVTDIYHGRLNVHLLPPMQLQQQLELISGHIQDDLTIPVDNAEDLYGLLHIHVKVTRKT
ncbi:uncharacterized protein LOC125235908 [Leguminivora glycinivorella]|uniref:uncharacterized protein LOC125235908 n=1 Tax=Leguminivora glycinivorella TaxID=1035111 RepID=UPI00200E8010|nr:uncharacterized protein LOC125235908 [Leguminivora glycinivorella]